MQSRLLSSRFLVVASTFGLLLALGTAAGAAKPSVNQKVQRSVPGPQASVIGAGTPTRRQQIRAFWVGYHLAQRGVTVVTGGRGGVMEYAMKGAKAGGGKTIAILPGKDIHAANDYADTR